MADSASRRNVRAAETNTMNRRAQLCIELAKRSRSLVRLGKTKLERSQSSWSIQVINQSSVAIFASTSLKSEDDSEVKEWLAGPTYAIAAQPRGHQGGQASRRSG
jgi:hypothetical protein